ncbi:class I SAM-dependent methyltransferase [Thermodesulfovibrionales bacterium]|nr:class I SAM-dependent methyltransferase [Thermodesulfovibrionales bacterium]
MVAEQLIVQERGRILDIGCGEGHLLRRLKDKFEELYGLDIAPSRLREAEQKVKELYPSDISKFKFVEGNTDERLPFSDDYFDVITCIAVMEHVYDIFFLVKEAHRILKPGGYIIAEVPNIAYLKYRISFLLGKLPATSSPHNWKEIGWDGGHIHYFTMKKFCWLFEQQGFKIEKKTGSGFLAKFRNWWPSLLCGDLFIKVVKK